MEPLTRALPCEEAGLAVVCNSGPLMRRRFDESVECALAVGAALVSWAAGQWISLRVNISALVKTLEAAAERERVSGEQLAAIAELLTSCADGCQQESWFYTVATARSLLSTIDVFATDCLPTYAITAAPTPASMPLDFHRVRTGVCGASCVAVGPGLLGYMWDDAAGASDNNTFDIDVVDSHGDPVNSVEPSDVEVVVVEGGLMTAAVDVDVPVSGTVRVTYTVTSGSVGEVTLGVRVCGASIRGSPWTIPVCGLLPDCVRAIGGAYVCQWLRVCNRVQCSCSWCVATGCVSPTPRSRSLPFFPTASS